MEVDSNLEIYLIESIGQFKQAINKNNPVTLSGGWNGIAIGIFSHGSVGGFWFVTVQLNYLSSSGLVQHCYMALLGG